MKKFNLIGVLLLVVSLNHLLGQDFLVLKNGDEIKSKVIEINDKEIKYKKFDNLEGPTISTLKSEVFMIKYQNGTKDVINATPAVTNVEKQKSKKFVDDKPNRFGLYVNPLGFVQFGPMMGMELTIASHLIFDAHARFSPAGLLMYVVTKSDDGVSPYKISGLGVGGGIKYMAPSKIGGFYVGLLLENGWQTQYYDKDETWQWQSENKYIVTAANIGYMFRFSSGFYMKTGAIFGTANLFKDHWYYTKNYNGDSSIHDDGSSVQPFGMLELGLGLEF